MDISINYGMNAGYQEPVSFGETTRSVPVEKDSGASDVIKTKTPLEKDRDAWRRADCCVIMGQQLMDNTKAFYRSEISGEEFQKMILEKLRDAWDMAMKEDCIGSQEEQVKFFRALYTYLRISDVDLAVGVNDEEGEKIHQQNSSAAERETCDYFYYNAKYFYLCREADQIMGQCLEDFAEEQGVGNLEKEKDYAETINSQFGFNSVWSAGFKSYAIKSKIKMLNLEADPPEDFSVFYRESYFYKKINEEESFGTDEIHYLMIVNGVSQNSAFSLEHREEVKELPVYDINLFSYANRIFGSDGFGVSGEKYLKNFLLSIRPKFLDFLSK